MSIMDNIENIEHILGDLEAFRYGDKVFMTGQEWFEKFVYALLEDGTYEEGDTKDLDEVMDAARKAAGMTT